MQPPTSTASPTDRPVVVTHASGHIMNVNRRRWRWPGSTARTTSTAGARLPTGRPTGDLQGPDADGPRARALVTPDVFSRTLEPRADGFGRLADAQGVTTATDLVSELSEDTVAAYRAAAADPALPLRLVPALSPPLFAPEDGVATLARAHRRPRRRLHFDLVKLVVDGSIQGFTARLRCAGLPQRRAERPVVRGALGARRASCAWHRAGALLHIHTNGDEATRGRGRDAGARAQRRIPRADHRHTLQHCQMPDAALFRRIKALGLCVNLFANHIFYWGEAHVRAHDGPVPARQRMDAVRHGGAAGHPVRHPFGRAGDAAGPLFTAWCAVNRLTASGRVLGAGERIAAAAAPAGGHAGRGLHAEAGRPRRLASRWASSPTSPCWTRTRSPSTPVRLKDIGVHATVLGGAVMSAG